MECGAKKVVEIPVERWHALTQEGGRIPMRFHVPSESMYPLIRRGRDTVTVLPLDRPLRIGDIVLFTDLDNYVLHRVWKIDAGRVQTFGDGCLRPDQWIPLSQVLGRAQSIRRGRILINPDRLFWRLWARLWIGLWPLRGVLFLPRRAFRGLRRRIGNIWK